MGGRLIHGFDLYTGKYGIWNFEFFNYYKEMQQ